LDEFNPGLGGNATVDCGITDWGAEEIGFILKPLTFDLLALQLG
jgi:hypothetical protein